jgi:hypothetical protein
MRAMANATTSDENNDGISDRLDRDLAARAYKKVMAGQLPSVQERNALRRFEKERDEKLRWQHYASIPQKHWRQMSGRQTKVLQEQAERYGIPFASREISLPRVVKALHDFLAANARHLPSDADLLGPDFGSPALERYREEKAAIAKLDRLEREGELIEVSVLRDGLNRIAAILRSAGDSLDRRFGPEARQILNDALDDAHKHVEDWLGGGDGTADG